MERAAEPASVVEAPGASGFRLALRQPGLLSSRQRGEMSQSSAYIRFQLELVGGAQLGQVAFHCSSFLSHASDFTPGTAT